MVEMGRSISLTYQKDKYKNMSAVMLAQRYRVFETFHKRAALVYPLYMDGKIIGRSRSSYIGQLTLSEVDTGNVALVATLKIVCIDEVTKRSKTLPEDMFKEITVPFFSNLGEIFPPVFAEKEPASSFGSSVEVQPSDTDFQNHTAHSAYMKFALDGIAKAAREGVLSGIKDDVCFYRGHTEATIHMGESFIGDVLTVKVWENQEIPLQIHCSIQKNGERIYYSEICFYPRENNNAKL